MQDADVLKDCNGPQRNSFAAIVGETESETKRQNKRKIERERE